MARSLFFAAVCLLNICSSLSPYDQQQADIDAWVATLDAESLKEYKRDYPERFMTYSEKTAYWDDYIANDGYNAITYKVYFSGPFTNNAVLQREPLLAAVYGGSNTPNVEIVMTMTDQDKQQSSNFSTTSMSNGDWKIVFDSTYPNGGNFTLEVFCDECSDANNAQNQRIVNITFGDVFYCSGQSNMQLKMQHTFSRNYTYSNITKLGKYQNIRFFIPRPYTASKPTYVFPVATQVPNQWKRHYDISDLDNFGSPCWYTAQELSDNYGLSDINFGLVNTAVGGSMIESWVQNFTLESNTCNDTNCPGPGCAYNYNGLVCGFLNMTVKTILWYQGENNVGKDNDTGGNWMNNTGYACKERFMLNQWRTQWSVVDGATDKLVPFGLVTLAAGTSEGHQPDMGSFRWGQSMNFDYAPNDVLKNTFIADGYDIGDPWGKPCGPECTGADAPYSNGNTHWLDGPIHPRPKIYVGQRLARGANAIVYGNDSIINGPLIESCGIDTESGLLTVNFNKSMLYGEQVSVQEWSVWYNQSVPRPLHWSATQIQLENDKKWTFIDDDALKQGSDGYSVTIDVNSYITNQTIVGLRYAYLDYPCCGAMNKSETPCPMNSCPIVSSQTTLPAKPFWALIKGNACHCFAPQVC